MGNKAPQSTEVADTNDEEDEEDDGGSVDSDMKIAAYDK
jgi:hypothetical protein